MPGGSKFWLRAVVAAAVLLAVCPSAFSRPVPAAWQPAPMKRSVTNHWQTVTVTPRPGLPKIHFYNKLNPVWWFGNIDDPAPPDWYRPNSKHRTFLWHLRNPFHNFDYYVIGIADKPFKRTSRLTDGAANPPRHWDFTLERRKLAVLPFISYHRGRFNLYFGWRERGNFGIKLNFPKPPGQSSRPKTQATQMTSDIRIDVTA